MYLVMGMLVFVSLFLTVDYMSTFIQSSAPALTVFKYYAYFLPGIIYQMVPMACLLATVFTLSNLNKNSELVALFSMGHSLARISSPILVVVAIVSVFSFWVGDRLIPKTNQKKNYINYVEIKKKPGLYSTVKTNKIWYRSENVLFNIKTLNAKEAKAQGLTLYYFDSAWDLIQLIKAKNVSMDKSIWTLRQGNVTLFTKDSSFPLTKNFREKIITVNEDVADLESSVRSSDVLSVKQLNKFITKNKEAGLDTLHYEVDYQGKFGFAFAAFVMSLMGIPFSVKSQRSGGKFISAGVCLGLTFFYWTLYSSSITLGKHGVIPPLIAAWAPNVVMGALALFLLVRLKK